MANFNNKKAYLFDLDGTVIDSKQGIFNALYYTFDTLGLERPNEETARKFIGPSIGNSLMNLYSFTLEEATNAVDIYREYYGTQGLKECSPYEGIIDIFKELKAQNKYVAIATKKPEIFAKRIITNLHLNQYIDIVCGSSPEETHDDKSHIIFNAVNALSVDLDEAVMVGDTKYDVIGAKKVGVECIGVLYGYGSKREHEYYDADFICDDMNHLKKTLCES